MENEYDAMLAEAEADAEDEIAQKLAEVEFDGEKMREAFKDEPESDDMENLIAHLGNAADSAAKTRAWQQFGVNAGFKALKLAKKALIGCALFAFMSPAVASAGVLDLSGFFDGVEEASKRSRMGVAVDLNATTKSVGYTPLAWDKARGYWDIGLGFNAKRVDDAAVSAGIGLNLVAMAHDLLKNVWGNRVGILPIQGLWVGPVISAPPLDNLSARWDYRERIDIYVTYAFFGENK